MTAYPRYAIYYVPAPESDLYRFGSGLLGYDAYTGETLPVPGELIRAVPDWRDLTLAPRTYGFHATLKAPLALARGKTEDDLRLACEAFAGTIRAVPVIEPVVSNISDFVAIIPAKSSTALDQLARDCVSALDDFRAPLTVQDRARRKPATLTARQAGYLDRWGYPYVMDEFRFHMTLTGRLPAPRQALVDMLNAYFSGLKLKTIAVDRIALGRQDSTGSPFRILFHWPLRQH
jgi:putative phosphonate metabolism protein